MTGDQLAQLVIALATLITAAATWLKQRTTEKKIDENTIETKNGHAIKERLAEEVVFWRKEAMKYQIKAARGDAVEEAMKLSPEGRAFLAVLEKNYGWRVSGGQETKTP